jgi:hypothetical protein
VYKKSVSDLPPVNFEDYALKKMSYDSLYNAVSATPELSLCLETFCRHRAHCYALFGNQEQILAIGFFETAEVKHKTATSERSLTADVAEIIHLQAVNNRLEKGVGKLLVELLAREAFDIGFKKVFSRAAVQDITSQKVVLDAGFELAGEERVVSTALMGGCSRIMGKVEV